MAPTTLGLPAQTRRRGYAGQTGNRMREVGIGFGVFAVAFVATAARNPSVLLHPELWAEDGAIWFQNAYDRGWWHPLQQPHTGYLQTFPRVVADVALLLPLSVLPLVFVIVALFVQALPAWLLASSRFSHLVPSRLGRLVLAAGYLAVPNAMEVNANLTNAQWHLGLCAVLIVLSTTATTRSFVVFDLALLAMSGLTGPFCLALFPISLLMAVLSRTRVSIVCCAVITATALVQAYELLTSTRGHFGPLGVLPGRLVEILGGQIVLGTVLGNSLLSRWTTRSQFLLVSSLALFFGAVLVALVLYKAPLELKLFNVFVALVLGASLLSPVATNKTAQWLVLAKDPEIRYWFLPAVAIVFDLIWLASTRSPRVLGAVGIGLVVVLAAFGMRDDWSIRSLVRVDWATQVRQFSALSRGERFVFHIDPRGWHMVLVKH